MTWQRPSTDRGCDSGRICVGKIGQYTLIEVREAIVWIISAAGGTRGVLLCSETLCPCLWESCLHNAAGQNTALLSCNRTVYDELFSVSLLAVNFTCASVNGILSLPPTAGVSSTSYLPLAAFCTLLWVDLTHQSIEEIHLSVYKYGVVFARSRSWISSWNGLTSMRKQAERRGWDYTSGSRGESKEEQRRLVCSAATETTASAFKAGKVVTCSLPSAAQV